MGFILKHPASNHRIERSGGEHNTTNNRMEIMAVIMGLEAIKVPCRVDLERDSEYVVKAIKEWMGTWQALWLEAE